MMLMSKLEKGEVGGILNPQLSGWPWPFLGTKRRPGPPGDPTSFHPDRGFLEGTKTTGKVSGQSFFVRQTKQFWVE